MYFSPSLSLHSCVVPFLLEIEMKTDPVWRSEETDFATTLTRGIYISKQGRK